MDIITRKRNFQIFLVSSLVISLASGIFGPFYIIFIQQKGGNIENFGIALGIMALTKSVASLFTGKYSDILGRKPLLISEGYASALLALSYIFIFKTWHLYALQLINGILVGTNSTVGTSFLTDNIDQKNKGRDIGKYMAVIGVATSIAIMTSGYVVKMTSIKLIFVGMAIASAFSASLLFFIKEKSPKKFIGLSYPIFSKNSKRTNKNYT